MTVQQAVKVVRTQLADSRAELADLRALVLETVRTVNSTVARGVRAVGSLQLEKAAHQREIDLLRASLKDRERVEKELREKVAAFEGKTVPSSEVPRLKEDNQHLTQLLSTKEARIEALQRELEAALEKLERAEVEAARAQSLAVMRQSASSSDINVNSLYAQLEAVSADSQRLQGDLDTQAKSHQLRIHELQECFQVKIRDLRRQHEEQLTAAKEQALKGRGSSQQVSELVKAAAAAEAALQTAQENHQRQLGQMQQTVAQLEKEMETTDMERMQQLESTLEAARRQNAKLIELEKVNKQLKEALEQSQERVNRLSRNEQALQERLQEAGSGDRGSGGADRGSSAAETEALEIMETQVLRLSEIIRAKEQELTAMRITVQAGCFERAELQRAVHKLTGSREIPPEMSQPASLKAEPGGQGCSRQRALLPSKTPSSPSKHTTMNTGGPGTLSYMRRTRHGGGHFR